MTTERPDAREAPSRGLHSVPTPRSGIPTGFGVTGGTPRAAVEMTPTADEPERRSRAVTIVAVLLAVVALVAVAVAFRVLVPAATSSAAAPTDPEQAAREVQERPGSVVDFGQVFTYGDGLDIAVNPPQRYDPSANAAGVEQGVPTRVQVVMTNRTQSAFRPNTLEVKATSGGQDAVAVWDPDQGIGLTGPDVSIPVGATIQFSLAFASVDPADLRLEITPAIYGYGAMTVQRP